ncbi:MAG: hypothetical protein PHR40_05295, partial [Bacteroidales bacterium]|nr:hypothetical protein [Bacteroidales bacterium]
MIQFAQAEYFLLILLVPILFLFHGVNRRVRRKRIEKLGERAILEKLMPRASSSRGWIKLSILSIAFFFFVVGLAR